MATAKRKTEKKSTSKSGKVSKIETNNEATAKRSRISPLKLIVFIIVLGLIFLVYKSKNMFVAGVVNNQPITAIELNKRMNDAYGKQILDQIITEKLLLNEAKKRNITISKAEIDSELSNVESSLGGVVSLDEALSQQGMTKNQLVDQIKLRVIVTKLVDNNVAVTDDEVNKYMESNKAYMGDDAGSEKTKNDIRNYLKEQKVNEQIQSLIKELKEKAKIVTFI